MGVRRYPFVLLLLLAAIVLSAGLAASAIAFPTFTQGAGTIPSCETCHSQAQVHGVTDHATVPCGTCHTVNTLTPPAPAACTTCHGAASVIIVATTHAATGCNTTPGCHGVPAAGAAITSITPDHALAGASVTIAGTGFGAATGTVMFGATPATVTSWSATSIVVTVPVSLAPGPVNVTVTPDGGSASAPFSFTVDLLGAAVITSITPAQATAGTSVTIAGTGFGAAPGTVMFGSITATVTSWSDTSIVVTVPESLAAGSVQVTVTPQGGAASAGFTFIVQATGTDTTFPVTSLSGAVNNRWYNHSLTITLSASDAEGVSDVASITYTVDSGTPVVVSGASATVQLTVDRATHTTDGAHVITYFAADLAGNIETVKTLTVNIDTRHPGTKALARATVHRYGYVRLRYEVSDRQPCSGKARVVIQIKRGTTLVKTLRLGVKPVNRALSVRVHATMRSGTYRYYVRATDTAGNRQANVASARLVVLPAFQGGSW